MNDEFYSLTTLLMAEIHVRIKNKEATPLFYLVTMIADENNQ